jgi:signal transduction histidine kinase
MNDGCERTAQPKKPAPLLHATEHALRERVKELTCLYGIAQLAARPGITREEIFKGVINLLAPAWQYPEITRARITLDDRTYTTPEFAESSQHLAAPILVRGIPRGSVEVFYVREMPQLDEGPFLKEERNLIDAVAGHVALILERREAEKETSRLETEVQRADRLASIGQLAAGVAHELNNPLTAVLTYGHLLRRKINKEDPAQKSLDAIIQAGERCREIVRDLLDFARERRPAKTATNPNDVLKHVLDMIGNQLQIRKVRSTTSLLRELPHVWADPHELEQVFINICINALAAMEEGGTLAVASTHDPSNDAVRITFEDTGAGIKPENLKRIFDPFFTTREVGQGTGLGLAVSQRIIDDHQGTITVESRPGEGTTFTITLPTASPGAAPGPESH